jgi:LPS-assembly protein
MRASMGHFAAWQTSPDLVDFARLMKHLRAILVLLGMALAAASHAAERPEPELTVEAVSPEGQFDYDLATGVATASGGVRVRYGEATLTARRVMLNQGAGRVFAEGQVRIQQEGMVWVGDSVTYDFQRRQINADLFRTGQTPIFAAGEVVTTDPTNKAYIAKGAFITTDDYAEPLQRIRASQIKIIPGQYVEARHATLYYGKVPVFYWPYYRRFLKRHPNYFQFTPGYRGRFGPFLLGSYHWHGSDYFDGTLHLDYRQKRGLGLGPDVNFHLGKYGEGQFK